MNSPSRLTVFSSLLVVRCSGAQRTFVVLVPSRIRIRSIGLYCLPFVLRESNPQPRDQCASRRWSSERNLRTAVGST